MSLSGSYTYLLDGERTTVTTSGKHWARLMVRPA